MEDENEDILPDEEKPAGDEKPADEEKPADDEKPPAKPEPKPAVKPAVKPATSRATQRLEEERDALQSQVATLTERAQRADVLETLKGQVKATGIKDEGVVTELVLARKGELTFEDGKVEGLADLLKDIKTKHPGLFYNVPGSADAGSTTPVQGFNADNWFRSILGVK